MIHSTQASTVLNWRLCPEVGEAGDAEEEVEAGEVKMLVHKIKLNLNKIREVDRNPARVQDTAQCPLIAVVTTISFMVTRLGFVKPPSDVPGRTSALKGHRNSADLTTILTN